MPLVSSEVRRFELRVDALPQGPREKVTTILVDGVDLFETATGTGYMGFDPDVILTSDLPLLPRTVARLAVYRCTCGESGCGALTARIRRRPGGLIEWSDFRDYSGYYWDPLPDPRPRKTAGAPVPLGTMLFDAEQYTAEVRRATEELHGATADHSAE